ncbi:hypothetical protein MTO96_049429 [Rhipicephalus appendiculatus]
MMASFSATFYATKVVVCLNRDGSGGSNIHSRARAVRQMTPNVREEGKESEGSDVQILRHKSGRESQRRFTLSGICGRDPSSRSPAGPEGLPTGSKLRDRVVRRSNSQPVIKEKPGSQFSGRRPSLHVLRADQPPRFFPSQQRSALTDAHRGTHTNSRCHPPVQSTLRTVIQKPGRQLSRLPPPSGTRNAGPLVFEPLGKECTCLRPPKNLGPKAGPRRGRLGPGIVYIGERGINEWAARWVLKPRTCS